MPTIAQKLEAKLGIPGVIELLDDRLSGSELNSLLLALYRKKTAGLSPAALLRQMQQNRFVKPGVVNPVLYKQDEIDWLQAGDFAGFKPIQLSPLGPLGSCAVFGKVDQNNVVSATRGTEVVADATNMMALVMAGEFANSQEMAPKHYCTTHRHVRGQYFSDPRYAAHFGIYCMVSGGSVQGEPTLPLTLALEHISFYCERLKMVLPDEQIWLDLLVKDKGEALARHVEQEISKRYPETIVALQESKNPYYGSLQFRFDFKLNGSRLNIADGGFVDWAQQLLANKKQRMVISGIGLEILHRIEHGLI